MPRVINRRKQRFVTMDRSLMRDKRLKSNHKLLYAVLCSLSESCDNVFPSYTWLAEEVGYDYKPNLKDGQTLSEENKERALRKFINDNLEPLIELKMLTKTANSSNQGFDFEVHDYVEEGEELKSYSEEQKSSLPGNNNVPTHTIGERRIEKTPISPEGDSPSEMIIEQIARQYDLTPYQMQKLIGEFKVWILAQRKLPDNTNYDSKFFNFAQAHNWRVKKDVQHTPEARRLKLIMRQYNTETREEFEQRVAEREAEGDVFVEKVYAKSDESKPPDTPTSNLRSSLLKNFTPDYTSKLNTV